jgi:predicted nucleotidyltransferase
MAASSRLYPDGMSRLGSERHGALIDEVVSFYAEDERILAVAVFGSVGAGTWHELSDLDLDVVIVEGSVVGPREEVEAIFGMRATIVLVSEDSADVVLDSLEEISIRWHPPATTSPNISSTVHVVAGSLSDTDVKAFADANRAAVDGERSLDALVRAAIRRGRTWSAVVAVQEMRAALTSLRGQRDTLSLDPSHPEDALARVLADARSAYDLGHAREALLTRLQEGLHE